MKTIASFKIRVDFSELSFSEINKNMPKIEEKIKCCRLWSDFKKLCNIFSRTMSRAELIEN